MENPVVWLVSCGKHKNNVTCRAKDLYNSSRFQKVRELAESCGARWYIISAKYGLLDPNSVIEPYDVCMEDCSAEYLKEWLRNIAGQLSTFGEETTFAVIADADYSGRIVPLLNSEGFSVIAPFIREDNDSVAEYMQRAVHVDDVVNLYDCVIRLAEQSGGVRVLRECNGRMYWPRRGVYFFVDFHEQSMVSHGFPRIVRVGTHAVSNGAKSTLWQRLKTHKGTENGYGNHRGSIFRLHVGNAIMNKEGITCDTWGIGQNVGPEIREKEKFIERLVSEYIGQLGVVVLDINDIPCSTSDRAYIERNSIALLSSLNASCNFSTLNWLGNWSVRDEIVHSCLWNIDHISAPYEQDFMRVLKNYTDKTIENYNKRG